MKDQLILTSEPEAIEDPEANEEPVPTVARKDTNSPPLTESNKGVNLNAPKRKLVVCIDGTSNQFSDKVGYILICLT